MSEPRCSNCGRAGPGLHLLEDAANDADQPKARGQLEAELAAAHARIAELEEALHLANLTASQPQNRTGDRTEALVRAKITELGLEATRPFPDYGVDLEVRRPGRETPVVRLQVKGRGAEQTNKKYRWFQIRTTSAQRKKAVAAGHDVTDTWRQKVALCDFFVLVALRLEECWVMPQAQVLEIGEANRLVYGNRAGSLRGEVAELDLDIAPEGELLTERYDAYRNAFHLIEAALAAQG